MRNRISVAVSRILLTVGFFCALQLQAQQPGPIPAPMLTAKKVFITNAGADAALSAIDQEKGLSAQYYNQFYASMKNWAHYELVASPDNADLVLEIYASSPFVSTWNGIARLQPQIQLSIFDGKTHFLLWRLTQSLDATHPAVLGGAGKPSSVSFVGAVEGVVLQLKALTATPAPGSNK